MTYCILNNANPRQALYADEFLNTISCEKLSPKSKLSYTPQIFRLFKFLVS